MFRLCRAEVRLSLNSTAKLFGLQTQNTVIAVASSTGPDFIVRQKRRENFLWTYLSPAFGSPEALSLPCAFISLSIRGFDDIWRNLTCDSQLAFSQMLAFDRVGCKDVDNGGDGFTVHMARLFCQLSALATLSLHSADLATEIEAEAAMAAGRESGVDGESSCGRRNARVSRNDGDGGGDCGGVGGGFGGGGHGGGGCADGDDGRAGGIAGWCSPGLFSAVGRRLRPGHSTNAVSDLPLRAAGFPVVPGGAVTPRVATRAKQAKKGVSA
eukprot:737512-Pleurochrysis_carterae.AAC.4